MLHFTGGKTMLNGSHYNSNDFSYLWRNATMNFVLIKVNQCLMQLIQTFALNNCAGYDLVLH